LVIQVNINMSSANKIFKSILSLNGSKNDFIVDFL
jgi:hypothetical protein